MAGGSPQHATLVAATIAPVSIDLDFDLIEVMNVSGTATIYFTTDGTAPVALATGTFAVPAVAGAVVRAPAPQGNPTLVRLLSTGTPVVMVRGLE